MSTALEVALVAVGWSHTVLGTVSAKDTGTSCKLVHASEEKLPFLHKISHSRSKQGGPGLALRVVKDSISLKKAEALQPSPTTQRRYRHRWLISTKCFPVSWLRDLSGVFGSMVLARFFLAILRKRCVVYIELMSGRRDLERHVCF